MDKLIIVMPVYNEEVNLERTVKEWHPLTFLGVNSKLLLMNDGSLDSSYEILKKLENEYQNVIIMTKPNEGHGPTVRKLYQEALNLGADYIFQTDSDGQTDPGAFQAFWEAREQYAMQIGNRKPREDGISRVIVSYVLKLILLLFFGQWCKDPNAPFRLMHREVVETFLPLIPENFNLTNAILSVFVSYSKMHSRYVDIRFKPRQGGKNSINISRIIQIGLETMRRMPAINAKMRKRL